MDTPEAIINSAVNDATSAIARNSRFLAAMFDVRHVLDTLQACASVADVETVYASPCYYESASADVDVRLHDRPSTILREFVRRLGVKASKRKMYSGDALLADMTYNSVRISFSSYIPPTCEVVYEDVVIPAREARVERRARIVCAPDVNASD